MRLKDGFKGERSIVLPKKIVEMMQDDPLMAGLHITDIGYYPKAANHYCQRDEPIDQYVFIYCVDGAGFFQIGEDKASRRQVVQNQYFILPAGMPHVYGADPQNPWTIYWIHFRGPLARHYAEGASSACSINPGTHSRISNRINLFEEIFTTLHDSWSIENLRYAMSLFHHYLGSLRYLNQYRHASCEDHSTELIDAAIHYMSENLEHRLSLKEIADFTGFSASHFSSLFKERTGHSPLNYFNILKIRKACELIDETTMKLNQISSKLGFSDQLYFSRLFSSIMGMSPKAYRTRQQG